MTISHVQLFSIPVSDQDRAAAFYRDVLGFTVLEDQQMGPGMRWVRLGFDGAATSITLVTWFDSMPAGSLRGLVLGTDDLEAMILHLDSSGVAVSAPQSQPWGRFVQIADPDGNGIIIQTAPEERTAAR